MTTFSRLVAVKTMASAMSSGVSGSTPLPKAQGQPSAQHGVRLMQRLEQTDGW